MQPTLTVESFPELTEQASADALAVAHTDAFGEMRRAEIRVVRSDWETLNTALDRRADALRVDTPAGETLLRGRLDTVERDGAERIVTVGSGELDIVEGEPMPTVTYPETVSDPGTLLFQLIDGTSRTDASNWITLGTGEDAIPDSARPVYGEVTVGQAPLAQVIRDQAALNGHELHYRNAPDQADGEWVLDYHANAEWHRANGSYDAANHLGEITGVTLSPDDGSIIGTPRLEEDTRLDTTHVKAFGAQNGPKQLTATAVADDYSGERATYEMVVEKSVSDRARLEGIAETRLTEIRAHPRLQEVTVATPGRQFVRGDYVTLSWPEESINRQFRIVGVTDRIDEDGVTQELTLSTRRRSRPATKRGQPARSVANYETGFGGYLESQQLTSGFRTVSSGGVQRLELYDFPAKAISVEQADLVVDGRASPGGTRPTDVVVEIDGSTVDTIDGGTAFSNRYDVSGVLSAGENTITAEPASEGDLSLTILFEVLQAGDTFDG